MEKGRNWKESRLTSQQSMLINQTDTYLRGAGITGKQEELEIQHQMVSNRKVSLLFQSNDKSQLMTLWKDNT